MATLSPQYGGVMNTQTRVSVSGSAAVPSVLELEALTLWEFGGAFDAELSEPLLNPWSHSYAAILRRALGH